MIKSSIVALVTGVFYFSSFASASEGTQLFYKALDTGVYKITWTEDGKCQITTEVYSSSCTYSVPETTTIVSLDSPYTQEALDSITTSDGELVEVPILISLTSISIDMKDDKYSLTEKTKISYPENGDIESKSETNTFEGYQGLNVSELAPLSVNGYVAIPFQYNDNSDDLIVNFEMDGSGEIIEGLEDNPQSKVSWSSSDQALTLSMTGADINANYNVIDEMDLGTIVLSTIKTGDQERIVTGVAAPINMSIYNSPLDIESLMGTWTWMSGDTTFEYQVKEGQEFALRGGPETEYDFGVWSVDGSKIIGDRYLSRETGLPFTTFEDQLACHNSDMSTCEKFQTRWYKVLDRGPGQILVYRYLEVIGGGYKGHWVHVLDFDPAETRSVSSNSSKRMIHSM